MEQFSALPKSGTNVPTKSCPRHAVFHSFLSDDSKKEAANTTSYRKRLMELSRKRKVLKSALSKIWEIMMVVQRNTDVPQNYNRCQLFHNVTQL